MLFPSIRRKVIPKKDPFSGGSLAEKKGFDNVRRRGNSGASKGSGSGIQIFRNQIFFFNLLEKFV